jgi:hypothetical protein
MKQKYILTPWLEGNPLPSFESVRRYTHSIVVFDTRNGLNKWGVLSSHGSEEAAQNALTARWKEIYPQHKIVGLSERIGTYSPLSGPVYS